MDARPTLLHTNPMELGPENTFSAQNKKNPKGFMIFDPKKGGGVIFPAFLTPNTHPHPLPQKSKKSGGCVYWTNNDFTRG